MAPEINEQEALLLACLLQITAQCRNLAGRTDDHPPVRTFDDLPKGRYRQALDIFGSDGRHESLQRVGRKMFCPAHLRIVADAAQLIPGLGRRLRDGHDRTARRAPSEHGFVFEPRGTAFNAFAVRVRLDWR